VAVWQHISTVCGQWRSDSTYRQCVGSGGLTAHIDTGSDKTVLTANAAVPTETGTGHWTGGHCAESASWFGKTFLVLSPWHWSLCSSGCATWRDVSGQPVCPVLKGQVALKHINITLRKKLTADCSHTMLVVIACRVFCLTVWYPKYKD